MRFNYTANEMNSSCGNSHYDELLEERKTLHPFHNITFAMKKVEMSRNVLLLCCETKLVRGKNRHVVLCRSEGVGISLTSGSTESRIIILALCVCKNDRDHENLSGDEI